MRELFEYIEGLVIGQGRYAGQKMRLFPWQRRFLRGAFGQPDDAAMSLARGGGKSTFTSAIACAALDGPLAEPMAEVLIVASSFDQGLVNFRHIQHFLKPTIEADPKRWRIQDSANRATITDKNTGAMLRVLGSDPRRLHGAAPKLILADEVAQWPETQIDRTLSVLETSRGKITGSKMLWLGTRAARPDHPFEAAFNQVGYSQVHAARDTDPVFQRRTWKKANPGLDRLPDLELAIRQEAARAKRDPSALARFKALRLNLGVSDIVEGALLDAEVWRGIETEELVQAGGQYVLGIDLVTSAAMSAAAAFWIDSGGLDSFAVFPEQPHLHDRGLADGVDRLYVECFQRGELLQAGRRVSDIGSVLRETLNRWGPPAAIVCDRWREAELRQELDEVRYPRCAVVVRGMGFMDGGADVREFRSAVLDGYVQPVKSLLMRSAMSGARVQIDAAGNQKLSKGGQGRRLRCRDGAVAAAILAVSEGRRRAKAEAQRQPFTYAVL